jgi:hypothetical protein
MRLLRRNDDGTFSLVEFHRSLPPYAILSHRWYEEVEEVNMADITNGTGWDKRGYSKLSLCADYAAANGLQYFWVDTCCIDKANSVELQEAINSMFLWYSGAERCYVYMSDVRLVAGENSNRNDDTQPFHKSAWFTRGWTLQELIAPSSVGFFDQSGLRIGDKQSLLREIVEITGIPERALCGAPLSDYTIKGRLSWASRRVTTREEDEAYCLLGIVGVHIPLLYGEGLENAHRRLYREIALSQSWVQQIFELLGELWPRQVSGRGMCSREIAKRIQFLETYLPSSLSTESLQDLYFVLFAYSVFLWTIVLLATIAVLLLNIIFEVRHFILRFVLGAYVVLGLVLLFGRSRCNGSRYLRTVVERRLSRNTFNSQYITPPLSGNQSHTSYFRLEVILKFLDVRAIATYRRCYPGNLSVYLRPWAFRLPPHLGVVLSLSLFYLVLLPFVLFIFLEVSSNGRIIVRNFFSASSSIFVISLFVILMGGMMAIVAIMAIVVCMFRWYLLRMELELDGQRGIATFM